MASIQDSLFVAIVVITLPAFFGGMTGEILYAGRLLEHLRRRGGHGSWRDAQAASWLFGLLTSRRAMQRADELTELARQDEEIARDWLRFKTLRLVTRGSLALLVIVVVLIGSA